MGKLRSRRHLRPLLGAPLAPTRSEINPQDVGALVRSLASLGLYTAPPSVDEAPVAGAPSAGDGVLYLALRLMARLGAHVPLPTSIPHDLVDELRRRLSREQVAAAELHAQTIMDEIEALLSGYLRLPTWRIDVDNPAVWRRLQQALETGEALTIRYWNAENSTPSERRITPYYVETQRHVRYLHAYCHLRQEERIFRVDRIEWIERGDGDRDRDRGER
jgi:hypothetical protein